MKYPHYIPIFGYLCETMEISSMVSPYMPQASWLVATRLLFDVGSSSLKDLYL